MFGWFDAKAASFLNDFGLIFNDQEIERYIEERENGWKEH